MLLDNIRIAFLVFNSRAEVLHANPSALKLIASRDWLWIADNRLKHHGKQPPELGSCITTASISKTAGRQSTMILESSNGDSPLLFSFSAITSTTEDPVTLCTVVDPAANFTTNVSALRDVYSLTEAEINIISLIAGGKDYKQIASERNVTVSTVRSFTKSIFKKLGVGSRAGVIHKVQSTSIQLSLLTD
jgi:DNA-binding CsgD family transcriptional regulator